MGRERGLVQTWLWFSTLVGGGQRIVQNSNRTPCHVSKTFPDAHGTRHHEMVYLDNLRGRLVSELCISSIGECNAAVF